MNDKLRIELNGDLTTLYNPQAIIAIMKNKVPKERPDDLQIFGINVMYYQGVQITFFSGEEETIDSIIEEIEYWIDNYEDKK